MRQPTGVIRVEVRQQHPAYVGWGEAQGAQLWPYLLLRAHPFPQAQFVVGMPPGEVAWFCHTGGLARVYHDQAFRVFNHPRIDRQWLCPGRVEEGEVGPQGSSSLATHLACFDSNGSCLNSVYTHGLSPFFYHINESVSLMTYH